MTIEKYRHPVPAASRPAGGCEAANDRSQERLSGYSAHPFTLAVKSSFPAGLFPGCFPLLLAPLVEELAWHSHGTDSLAWA